jgi:uncharacterized protein
VQTLTTVEHDVVMESRDITGSSEEPFEAVAPSAVLRGTLALPTGSESTPALVVAHGAAFGLRESRVYVELVEVMLSEGIAVLRYDRRGEGESTGNADETTLDDLAEDLLACVRTLQSHSRVRSDRVGLWGISQGGWLVALAAAEEPSIACIVAVSASGTGPAEQMEYAVTTTMRAAGYNEQDAAAALSARRVVGQWEDGIGDTSAAKAAIDSIKDEPWFPMAYLGDLNEDLRSVDRAWSHFDVRPALARIFVPVLLFLGDRDRWVDTVRSREIWQAELSHAELTVVSLKGAGHIPTLATDPDSVDVEESGPTHPEYLARLRHWVRSVLLN